MQCPDLAYGEVYGGLTRVRESCWLLIDAGGPSPLWLSPFSGQVVLECLKKLLNLCRGTSHEAAFLPGVCFKFLLDFQSPSLSCFCLFCLECFINITETKLKQMESSLLHLVLWFLVLISSLKYLWHVSIIVLHITYVIGSFLGAGDYDGQKEKRKTRPDEAARVPPSWTSGTDCCGTERQNGGIRMGTACAVWVSRILPWFL